MTRILFWPLMGAEYSRRTLLARWFHGISYFFAYCAGVVAFMGFLTGADGVRVLTTISASISIAVFGRLVRYFIGGE